MLTRTSILLIVVILFSITTYSQTLFTYGDSTVSKQEFLRAFNKNNNGQTIDNSNKRLINPSYFFFLDNPASLRAIATACFLFFTIGPFLDPE